MQLSPNYAIKQLLNIIYNYFYLCLLLLRDF